MGYSVGFLVYSGVVPLLKMSLAIFFGFWLTRRGFFTPAASRGMSQVTMNVALPGLLFSNIIPAFNMQNISAMGPLFLVAFVYMACGLLFGVFIREFCYVPRNFWAGILIATAMSSWTSLPTAVVLTVAKQKPFNPDTDPQLGVSYVSIFILAYNIVMWICGAANTLAWDYAPDVPQGDAANVRASWREKPIAAFFLRVQAKFLSRPNDSHCEKVGNDEEGADLARDKGLSVVLGKQLGEMEIDPEIQLPCRASRLSANSFQPRRSVDLGTRSRASSSRRASNASQPSLKELLNVTVQRPFITDEQELEPTAEEEKLGRFASLFPPFLRRTFKSLSSLFTPITMSMYIAIPVSLIPQLKALFVEVDGGPYYHGPDGNPPLTFIINTAEFVGNMTVPMSLILLGASFACMKIPRPFNKIPLPAMFWVAFCKLALLPVIGILLTQGLTHRGVIFKDALVERFVAMLLSGTPSSVNQLIVTQLYAKDHDLDTLSVFLLFQYIFMFVSTATITAVTLSLL
ncbi:auxin efflux carrier [Desarmillaria tabescens]|uniref:Auxin efflux carrier n=2 Tax=Armillaria tabescens TaxID=1929756 RepID=A0AA39JI16_ARMTA|nr:auxin efflux carrier [Desarmillaria tabescens]KAK0442814.1 auxin efflux carrier [Desarmillaria tabescens]